MVYSRKRNFKNKQRRFRTIKRHQKGGAAAPSAPSRRRSSSGSRRPTRRRRRSSSGSSSGSNNELMNRVCGEIRTINHVRERIKELKELLPKKGFKTSVKTLVKSFKKKTTERQFANNTEKATRKELEDLYKELAQLEELGKKLERIHGKVGTSPSGAAAPAACKPGIFDKAKKKFSNTAKKFSNKVTGMFEGEDPAVAAEREAAGNAALADYHRKNAQQRDNIADAKRRQKMLDGLSQIGYANYLRKYKGLSLVAAEREARERERMVSRRQKLLAWWKAHDRRWKELLSIPEWLIKYNVLLKKTLNFDKSKLSLAPGEKPIVLAIDKTLFTKYLNIDFPGVGPNYITFSDKKSADFVVKQLKNREFVERRHNMSERIAASLKKDEENFIFNILEWNPGKGGGGGDGNMGVGAKAGERLTTPLAAELQTEATSLEKEMETVRDQLALEAIRRVNTLAPMPKSLGSKKRVSTGPRTAVGVPRG